jgi:hypothetical protein
MSDLTPTGSDEEIRDLVDALADRVDEQWRRGDNPEVLDVSEFLAWRDAAVARFLADSGAVHPAVHTPTRIMNYLEQHGWQRIESPKRPKLANGGVFWSPPAPNRMRWINPHGIELDAPICDDLPNYADVVRVVVNRIGWAEKGHLVTPDDVRTDILSEIAQQSDEVAW